MGQIDEFVSYNEAFVNHKMYERYETSKYPDKKVAILACMDTRLLELLPAALGIRNGDVKIIKNAGAELDDPFDSVMRSLLIAVYELGVNEIMVIGHYQCGVQHMDGKAMIHHMIDRGVKQSDIEFLNYCGHDVEKWLTGFSCIHESVAKTVELIQTHPLMAKDVDVRGFIMDPVTGKVDPVQNASACAAEV